jgi:hypothetical protein
VDNYGQFDLMSDASNNRYLALSVTQTQNSLITLTFSADDILFVTNRSPGIILAAGVEEFEAGSKNGRMNVRVQSTGTIVADFHVGD